MGSSQLVACALDARCSDTGDQRTINNRNTLSFPMGMLIAKRIICIVQR